MRYESKWVVTRQHLAFPFTRDLQIFLGKFGRQELEHHGVLDPDFNHGELSAIMASAEPILLRHDREYFFGRALDAEREMGRNVGGISRLALHYSPSFFYFYRMQFGSGGINLNRRSVIIQLHSHVGTLGNWKGARISPHQLREYLCDMLRIFDRYRKMMNHNASLDDGSL